MIGECRWESCTGDIGDSLWVQIITHQIENDVVSTNLS